MRLYLVGWNDPAYLIKNRYSFITRMRDAWNCSSMQFDDRVGIDRVMQVMIMALRNINDLRFVMNSLLGYRLCLNVVLIIKVW